MLGSIQDKLLRVRPPRVRITYDVETAGAIEKKELPFIVGIFADLSGDLDPDKPSPAPLRERKMTEIDRDNFNDLMNKIKPRVALGKIKNVLEVPTDPTAPPTTLGGAIVFSSLDDFSPAAVVERIPALKKLFDSRKTIRKLQAKGEGSTPVQQFFEKALNDAALQASLKGAFDGKKAEELGGIPLPDDVDAMLKGYYTDGEGVEDADRKKAASELAGEFYLELLADLPADHLTGAAAFMDDRVTTIDARISRQLAEVMHAESFQKVEATWRGLHYLVSRTETGAMLKLRVLDASKKDLDDDLNKAVEFDQSGLFKMIYEAEYGTFGGAPYSLLVGDYEFGRTPDEIRRLGKIAEVAAAAHAPFIAAADAKLFDLTSFGDLPKPRDLQKIFETDELIEWRAFRESEDSRYVTLTLPKVLLRLPYGTDMRPEATKELPSPKARRVPVPAEGFVYEELKSPLPSEDSKAFLWGNPAFILAERITNAFSLYGWTAAIRGVEGGGLVEGLPVYTYTSDQGDVDMICPTQVSITDRREKELNDLGFMAICHAKKSNKAAFFGGQTTNKPKRYISDLANSNAQISAMLPYILAASRFAHY
ncbi:MAG: type VI secretion system contractile sheath large subunit, partial [Actinomycetota bacterium]